MFTQASNRRHQRNGHLFQGRYKAILVDADTYLMELIRYVAINPVRAGIVDQPHGWFWSRCIRWLGKIGKPSYDISGRKFFHCGIQKSAMMQYLFK